MNAETNGPVVLGAPEILNGLVRDSAPAPLPQGAWYAGAHEGDGLLWRFPPGTLSGMGYLSADFLADGTESVVLLLALREGEGGPEFHVSFALLNQCSARMRLPLSMTDLNRWRIEREGAWLKPHCGGRRVDLARVDRCTLIVNRLGTERVRFCATPLTATPDAPPRLTAPLLPRGPLVDEFGQNAIREWPEKTRSEAELLDRLRTQAAQAPTWRWPSSYSRWGGWTERTFDATGFFRTHHDGNRWWLVDPDGHAFWSAGLDCVRPDAPNAYAGLESALAFLPERDGLYKDAFRQHLALPIPGISYTVANHIRAFGPAAWHDRWREIALGFCRRFGFNTVANWSQWEIAREAGFPYVRPLKGPACDTPTIYRDFPDVFAPSFARDAARFAQQLRDTADDPAMIGYFLMNEPNWGFSTELPAVGMLYTTPACATRAELADSLRQRYADDAALAAAWGMAVTFDAVREGVWHGSLPEGAMADLEAFSERMVERLFRTLTDACRAVDPHHLNLGARYYTVPPRWAVKGMQCFDVFSVNCYQEKVLDALGAAAEMLHLPVLIGEWHFGALDAGPPAAGICTVATQEDRGKAFRAYTEDAAARPWCVGVHYFTLYDEGTIGRFDGENWNIGFLDVCNRPYAPLAEAARASHERLYALAAGDATPCDAAPAHRPRHFF